MTTTRWANPATKAELEALIPEWERICRDEPTEMNQLVLARLKERLIELQAKP